jgi:hypothetical protein
LPRTLSISKTRSWDARYAKQGVTPPAAKAIDTLFETGDFHVRTIGDKSAERRRDSRQIRNQELSVCRQLARTAAGDRLQRGRGVRGFAPRNRTREKIWHTGKPSERNAGSSRPCSGKLSSKLTHEAAFYLKEYFSTLEEARPDLMALWNVFDPKLE